MCLERGQSFEMWQLGRSQSVGSDQCKLLCKSRLQLHPQVNEKLQPGKKDFEKALKVLLGIKYLLTSCGKSVISILFAIVDPIAAPPAA